MRRNTMSYTHCPDTLDAWTEVISAIVPLWCILLRARRCGTNTKYIGPLLQRLIIVPWAKCSVYRAMPKFWMRQYMIQTRLSLHNLRMRGRVPLYPGYIPRTTSPQCCAVEMDCPPEQVLFHAAAAPEAETKHPAGTPEYSDTAVMSSG